MVRRKILAGSPSSATSAASMTPREKGTIALTRHSKMASPWRNAAISPGKPARLNPSPAMLSR
jgi:hypothetical protein